MATLSGFIPGVRWNGGWPCAVLRGDGVAGDGRCAGRPPAGFPRMPGVRGGGSGGGRRARRAGGGGACLPRRGAAVRGLFWGAGPRPRRRGRIRSARRCVWVRNRGLGDPARVEPFHETRLLVEVTVPLPERAHPVRDRGR